MAEHQANHEHLGTAPPHSYHLRWVVRPESGRIGWVLAVQHADRPLRTGGHHIHYEAWGWDTESVGDARRLAVDAATSHLRRSTSSPAAQLLDALRRADSSGALPDEGVAWG